MVATYAHAEIGALETIDAAFASVPDSMKMQNAETSLPERDGSSTAHRRARPATRHLSPRG
jgi:hypothetical protein